MKSEQESFEQFIMHCCRLPEWDLRDYLRKTLKEHGFTIREDNYTSMRSGRYKQIRNMLCIRGKTPRICLVAHTDVCRDHALRNGLAADVHPVIRSVMDVYDNEHRIITDKDNQVQVGGDDRLGVAINVWIALNTSYDMGLLFTTDEEIGALSAEECIFKELNDFDLLVQVDRGNHSNQLVTSIGNTVLCSRSTAKRLLAVAEQRGMPRREVVGALTDVLELKRNGACKEAVNMTCGYHNSYGSSSQEYIIIEEARDTMFFVSAILYDYEMELIEKIEQQFRTSSNSNVGQTTKIINGRETKIYYARSSQ